MRLRLRSRSHSSSSEVESLQDDPRLPPHGRQRQRPRHAPPPGQGAQRRDERQGQGRRSCGGVRQRQRAAGRRGHPVVRGCSRSSGSMRALPTAEARGAHQVSQLQSSCRAGVHTRMSPCGNGSRRTSKNGAVRRLASLRITTGLNFVARHAHFSFQCAAGGCTF